MDFIQPLLIVLVLLVLTVPGIYMVYKWVHVWETEEKHNNKLDDLQRQINNLKRELEEMKRKQHE